MIIQTYQVIIAGLGTTLANIICYRNDFNLMFTKTVTVWITIGAIFLLTFITVN